MFQVTHFEVGTNYKRTLSMRQFALNVPRRGSLILPKFWKHKDTFLTKRLNSNTCVD